MRSVQTPSTGKETIKISLFFSPSLLPSLLHSFHKVTKVDFVRRLYRLTKKELEVALDQQRLFDATGGNEENRAGDNNSSGGGGGGGGGSSSSSSVEMLSAELSKVGQRAVSVVNGASSASATPAVRPVEDSVFETPGRLYSGPRLLRAQLISKEPHHCPWPLQSTAQTMLELCGFWGKKRENCQSEVHP